MNPKYVFVVGGVMSSVGKGIVTASIGKIIQARGYKVTAMKIDPYINVDAGTMNPTEHGEVFVTDDKDETDQDLGNYERFLGVDINSINYMTTGRVYQTVINRERNLDYKGKCVQVVPHIPYEIIDRIKTASRKNNADLTVIEIGGTVGEYENILFLEAARMMKLKNPDDVTFVLVSYLPIPKMVGEMKTKPTQHAARSLNSVGIQADFIVARSEKPLDKPRRERLATFCNIPAEAAISAPDLKSIYEVPLKLENQGLGDMILAKLKMTKKPGNLNDWQKLVATIKSKKTQINIAVVGKYFGTGAFTLSDSYISVIEAVKHAAWANNLEPELSWLDSEVYEQEPAKVKELKNYDGLIVPGGFGTRGIEGIIKAIEFARTGKLPYLGLCYGMQLACVEFARHVAGIKEATTTEIEPEAKEPVIHVMPEQEKRLLKNDYGGTMRLGGQPCKLRPETIARQAYGSELISERHRHRYEFNNGYRSKLGEKGLIFSGVSPDEKLVEVIELSRADHPFFVATQFHPEFKSRPLSPHPLFLKFIEASNNDKKSTFYSAGVAVSA